MTTVARANIAYTNVTPEQMPHIDITFHLIPRLQMSHNSSKSSGQNGGFWLLGGKNQDQDTTQSNFNFQLELSLAIALLKDFPQYVIFPAGQPNKL